MEYKITEKGMGYRLPDGKMEGTIDQIEYAPMTYDVAITNLNLYQKQKLLSLLIDLRYEDTLKT